MSSSSNTPSASTPLLPSGSSVPGYFPRTRRRRRSSRWRSPPIYAFPAVFSGILFALVFLVAWNASDGHCRQVWLCRALGAVEEPWEEVWERSAGAYAPWRSLGHGGGRHGLPPGCEVDQVSILHRHAERYPTPEAGERLIKTLAKLDSRGVRVPKSRDLSFLRWADLSLDSWEFGNLTAAGREEAYKSGEVYAKRYKSLADADGLFIRTTDNGRVLKTSKYWERGFLGLKRNHSVLPDVVIPEGSKMNNTLSVHSCTKFEELNPPDGQAAADSLEVLLKDAAERLNSQLDPEPQLTTSDVRRLSDMCGYDTARENDGWSRWCRILTQDEWDIVSYIADAERWYHVGEGSRFGKLMGAGYVNELIARLTDSVPEDSTTVNDTLDRDPSMFPRGGHRIFADFTHDNEMIEILTAMGVRKMRRKLPVTHVVPSGERRFVLSQLIPFGARWAFERVSCPAVESEQEAHAVGEGEDKKMVHYVRVLLNDKPVQVDHMACRSSEHSEHHLCELNGFIESQVFATDEAHWAGCKRPSR